MELLFGQQAILSIVVHLFFIGVAWWALQALKFDLMINPKDVLRARILFILITIALGSAVAEFFLTYFYYSMQLKYLF